MKKFLRSQLKLIKPVLSTSTLDTMRKRQDTLGRFMARSYKNNVVYEDIQIGNMNSTMITPKNELSGGVILYFHGGGYVAGNLNYAKGFGTMLSVRFGIRVFCPEYRLAPEHIFPAAIDDAMDAYVYLLSNGYSPSQIILCGESAGGGLCYSVCQLLAKKGRTAPAGIIAISPWTDLTASGGSYITNEKKDPSMTKERLKYFADLYVYGAESFEGGRAVARENTDADADRALKSDPRMSPLFGSFEGMPPSLIFVGGDEIMLDDSFAVYQRLRAAGARCELIIAPEMWHGYVLYALKENGTDFDVMGRFIKENIPNQKKLRWLQLDNAAKIIPAARKRNWSNVFRLSATMSEDVDRESLAAALDVTVRRFPSIAVRIKTGVFWYYLEEIPKAPKILDEKPYPLARMPFDDIRKCAFRVIVYKKRIAIEFFHAITDGTGAMIFLKSLLAEYIYQKDGISIPSTDGILDRLKEPTAEEMEDSFLKYAGPKKASRQDTDAFKISGKKEVDGFKTNTTFILDADTVLSEARAMGVTVTAYLTAVFTVATVRVQDKRVPKRKKQRPIKILIPVNLRNLFASRTLRNFMLYVRPGIDPALGEYSFDEICKIISAQMKLDITEKNMAALMATNVGSETPLIIRIAPLFLKNIIMKLGFMAVGERKSSFSFSNLGVIKLPEALSEKIDRFDFVLGVQSIAPYNVAALTYKGKLYINIIRNISEPVLEAEIYKVFRELGIRAVVESNTRGGK